MYQSVAEYFSGIHLQYHLCHHAHNLIRLRDSNHARVLRQRDSDDCFRDLPDYKLYFHETYQRFFSFRSYKITYATDFRGGKTKNTYSIKLILEINIFFETKLFLITS